MQSSFAGLLCKLFFSSVKLFWTICYQLQKLLKQQQQNIVHVTSSIFFLNEALKGLWG